MPAYYSTFMTLEEFSPQRDISLSSIYGALLINDFKFGSKYPVDDWENGGDYRDEWKNHDEWECIISWNQERIDRNFRIGWTQNWKEGYQQFLLHHPLYKECRVITSSSYISIIVPEYEITLPKFEWYEGIQSINIESIQPLKELSLNVWSTNSVNSIQTAPENGGYTPYQKMIEGNLPFICPFAIVDKACSQKIKTLYLERQIREKELHSGSLLTSPEAIYGR